MWVQQCEKGLVGDNGQLMLPGHQHWLVNGKLDAYLAHAMELGPPISEAYPVNGLWVQDFINGQADDNGKVRLGMRISPDVELSPAKLRPPHPNMKWPTEELRLKSQAHVEGLARSMREHGRWDGLPLLVHPLPDGTYQAWMGFHRLQAAKLADVTVPVVLVTPAQLRSVGVPDDVTFGPTPWAASARLAKLSDKRPYQLRVAEDFNQPKRNF
jgi:hypothetical protein